MLDGMNVLSLCYEPLAGDGCVWSCGVGTLGTHDTVLGPLD